MHPIPAPLLEGLTTSDADQVHAWWTNLVVDTQREIVRLWDRRQDDCFFGLDGESGDRVPVVIGGRFIPHDDASSMEEWFWGHLEYLLNHMEVLPYVVRTFHIGCRKHPEAHAYLVAGRIPADFQCPLNVPHCPMRRLPSDPSPACAISSRVC